MKRFWLIFWLVFLVIHLLTLIIGHLKAKGRPSAGYPGDPQLVELARKTNDAWEELTFTVETAQTSTGDTAEEILLGCQSIIMQLKDDEQAFRSRGVEVNLVDDLQSWLARSPTDAEPEQVIQFLGGLQNWLEEFIDRETHCQLQRLMMQPEETSPFPVLAFEIGGNPIPAGRILLDIGAKDGAWKLREIDLFHPDPEENWWIRGSLAYAPE